MEKWEKYPHIWKSKSAYYVWLRGHFRKIWARYPIKLEFKKNNAYLPPEGYTGRAKRMGTCALCGEKNIPISQLEVDHIEMTGGFDCEESAMEWLWKLLCDEDNMQLVHKGCHKIKSYAERHGITFQDACIEKEAIDIVKNKKDKEWLLAHGVEPASNAKGRRLQIVETIKATNLNINKSD